MEGGGNMLEKLEGAWQYIAYTFGVGVAIGLFFLADLLTSPIKHRGYQELRDEIIGNFSSSFANIFRKAFDKSLLPVEKTYSVFTNMFLPMLLIMVAAIILLIVMYFLGRSLLFDGDQVLDKGLKFLLVGAIGYLTYKMVQNDWYLFVLNLKMAIIMGLLAFFVLALFTQSSQRR
jgi:hypothetical protein